MESLKAIFSAIIEFVKAAEAVYPAGSGKDKFDAVTQQVLAFAPLVGLSLDLANTLMPMFQAFTNTVVAYFNAKGLFTKSTSPTAAAATPPASA